MHLTMHEQERLLISLAAMVARDRMARGVKLNHPEAVAILCVVRARGRARRARRWPTSWTPAGAVLTRDDVMDGIPEMLAEVQVEATFPDGTKLVTIHEPDPR